MLRLYKSLAAWGTAGFEPMLKQELGENAELLPLQQALVSASSVADAPITVLVQSAAESGNTIRVKAGIFFQGLIGGCSCADDPTPESTYTEYCEVQLEIDKANAATKVALLKEL